MTQPRPLAPGSEACPTGGGRRAPRIALLLVAVLVSSAPACGGEPAEVGEPDDARVVERVGDAGDVRVRMRLVGDAVDPVVVLVHGGPGLSLEAMAAYEDLVEADLRVVSYDQRGAGRSSDPSDGRFDLAAHVADLEAVRRSAGADTVSLIGQSWGGAIAAAYTGEHPERVEALVLVGAVPLDVDVFLEGQARFRSHLGALQRDGVVADPLPEPADGSCLPAFEAALPAYVSEADLVPRLEGLSCDAATSRATYDAFVSSDLAHEARSLGRFRGPVLVVAGEHDAFGPAWAARNARLFTDAAVETHIVDDAGHLVGAEQPESLLSLVRSFLARERRVGSR